MKRQYVFIIVIALAVVIGLSDIFSSKVFSGKYSSGKANSDNASTDNASTDNTSIDNASIDNTNVESLGVGLNENHNHIDPSQHQQHPKAISQQQINEWTRRDHDGLYEEVMADGSVRINLQGRFQNVISVTKDKDGNLVFEE